MKRFVITACVVAASASAMLAAQAPADQTQARPVVLQKVLVKVNGAIFTKTELEALQIEALQQESQRALTQLDLQNDAVLRTKLIEITPGLIAGAVDELIMIQKAKDLGIRPSDERFKDYLDSIKKENQLDDATLLAALKQQGMTMEELRKTFDRNYLIRGVVSTEVEQRMAITEAEARQYYQAHPNEFMKPTMITVREISVLVPAETRAGEQVINVAADEAAEAKIKAARERALKGEDFAALVTEFSQSGSKANGGLIGPLNLNELAESLQKILSPLKAGDIPEPIRTPTGYQLLKVEAKDENTLEPFERVRNDVAMKVQGTRRDAETAKFLDRLRGQAIIEWKDDDLKKLYEQFMAQQKKDD
jgi:parvulin-like peptidyl-prolyl isomerase